ncbi:hypothetical protein C8R45DRAFT_316874 [Mycena sanguinolenta]|nr:hypothetical protein C8R45DRAFT_316874 [Mycena sanguinolenta]
MSSPFASHLGTNYCPQDDEVAQIKSLLIEPSLKLKSLDEEIAVLHKALEKLTEERDTLNTYVEAHKSLLSPFRRLPRDIVEVIFLACLPTHRNCVMSALEAPVLLGRICSSWRAISHSLPRLWSRLHIVKPPLPYNMNSVTALRAYQDKVAQRLEVSGAWLRRSGTCPLSISLQSGHHYDPSNDLPPPSAPSSNTPSSKDPFLNVLIPFASRWQDMSVTIPSSAVQALLDLTGHDVPRLKYLAIASDTDADPTWLSPGSILCAPGLSRFSLMGGDLHDHPSSRLPLPWSNLTALTLLTRDPQKCQDILDILAQCSQLQTCQLRVVESESEYRQDSIVECSSLHSIELWCSSPSPLHNSGRLLSRLSLPALQDFTLHGVEEPSDSGSLLSSLATCTRLQSINIASAMFRKHALVDFLRGAPSSVRRLCVAEPWHRGPFCPILDANFFEALEPSTVLPALEELSITTSRELSDEALLRFIISRMSTLRRVDIAFDREKQGDILPSLQSFLKSGAQVSITYVTDPSYSASPFLGLPDEPQLGY